MDEFKINYVKNKSDFLKTLENSDNLKLRNLQNYVPLYEHFFVLNDTNWNNINLEQRKSIIECTDRPEFNKFNCKIHDSVTEQDSEATVFVKFSPLLDPIKYVVGKYDHTDDTIFNLPKIHNESNCHSKVQSPYNSAYTDAFFSFLTSRLLNDYDFIHGLDFYGSYLCNQGDYRVNIFDDIEYISESNFFNKHKDELFRIDNEYYDIVCDSNSRDRKKRLQLGEELQALDVENIIDTSDNIISLEQLDGNLTSVDDIVESSDKSDTVKTIISHSSNSTCSSRSSHTTNSDDDDHHNNSDDDDCDALDSMESDLSDEEDGSVFAYIDNFPVDVICLESCKQTLDSYAFTSEDDEEGVDVEPDEWLSIFAQIIMQLIAYQKVFSFTHNDLHTNNIMYNDTDKQYIFYCYNGKYYKVPTYGKIWKIIDFGRAIYKVNGKVMCSDSFFPGEDAATQYNCEPFMNHDKPRLDPNYSFDLCRLGCSLFDYFLDDLDWLDKLDELDDVQRLVVDWCTDDKGKNILYKKNGEERYPEFKLYKMISRNVHKHTPHAQLDKECFSNFRASKKKIRKNAKIINIDNLPVCSASRVENNIESTQNN